MDDVIQIYIQPLIKSVLTVIYLLRRAFGTRRPQTVRVNEKFRRSLFLLLIQRKKNRLDQNRNQGKYPTKRGGGKWSSVIAIMLVCLHLWRRGSERTDAGVPPALKACSSPLFFLPFFFPLCSPSLSFPLSFSLFFSLCSSSLFFSLFSSPCSSSLFSPCYSPLFFCSSSPTVLLPCPPKKKPLLTCLPTCHPAYLPACLSTCLPACLPTYLPACLPTCLPACLSTCTPLFISERLYAHV